MKDMPKWVTLWTFRCLRRTLQRWSMEKAADSAVGGAAVLAQLLQKPLQQQGCASGHNSGAPEDQGELRCDLHQCSHSSGQTGGQGHETSEDPRDAGVDSGGVAVHPLDQVSAVVPGDVGIVAAEDIPEDGPLEITLELLIEIIADKL